MLGLLLYRLRGGSGRLHWDDWFHRWYNFAQRAPVPDGIFQLLLVAVPVVAVVFLMNTLEPVLFGFVWIVAAVVFLLWSLGRADIKKRYELYRARCREGDFEAVLLALDSQQNTQEEPVPVDSELSIHEQAQRYLLYLDLQSWFSVVFWFFVAGPAAAVAYRIIRLSHESDSSELLQKLLHVVDFIPARLVAVAFSLAGDFIRSRDTLLDECADVASDAPSVLYRVSDSALSVSPAPGGELSEWAERRNIEQQDLVQRAAGLWLVLLSLYIVLV